MKDKIFGVLQRVGRSFMLPIAILPVAGLLLGIGASFTNATTIETYGLTKILGEGTVLNALLIIMSKVGSAVFDNLPLLFAVGVAIGMAKKEKDVAALAAVIAYFVMNTSISAMLTITGQILPNGEIAESVLEGTIATAGGIQTLQTGVFGGVIVGLGVAALHNKFYKIKLPNALAFFGGTRFVPIISTVVYMLVGILLFFLWPPVQNGIHALGGLVTGSGYIGTLIFGLIKRALIPLGLHHVFYMPFWHTAVGGTMEIAGEMVQGGQNIFFAELANSADITHFSADATRFFSGEFIFMIFGLPGAALAMYHCAKPEKKKAAGGLLLSAALTSMATGITEPIEFSFLFVAPILFVVQVVLAGTAYMVAHILNIAVGLTFSGGLLDLLLFGVLQGNAKTSWLLIIPVGIVYFFLYYFIFKFLIKKLDLRTPGREDDDAETRLYTKADVREKRGIGAIGERKITAEGTKSKNTADEVSAMITRGLGGKKNIGDVDCCATRLRCTVKDESLVNDGLLRESGALDVLKKGKSLQVIYGPNVTVVKANLEEYLETAGDIKPITIHSPMKGKVEPLSNAPDEAFAGGVMGEGVVITPEDSFVYAPENGEVTMVFDTKHAIGLKTDSGVELLIHVGIDTVKLNGEGFETFVKVGQKVKKGEKLLGLDLPYLKKNATSLISPIICTSLGDEQKVRMLKNGIVNAGDTLFVIESK